MKFKLRIVALALASHLSPALADPADGSLAYVPQIDGSSWNSASFPTTQDLVKSTPIISVADFSPVSGEDNLAYTLQEGDFNNAAIQQDGRSNIGMIRQSGLSNLAAIQQVGQRHQAFIVQSGNGNTAIIAQR